MPDAAPLALLVLAGPDEPNAAAAVEAARAHLAAGASLREVFFQGDGVLVALDAELATAWSALATKHGFALDLCVTSAMRRGIDAGPQDAAIRPDGSPVPAPFRIAGLAQLIAAGLDARLVSFP